MWALFKLFIGTNSVSDYGMLNISLRHSSNRIVTSLERLATGMKINTAGDDAANLSLSEKLKSRISSSVVLQNNASTGIDLLNIVDGDLKTMTDIVQRIKNLTIQGLNGVYSEDENKNVQEIVSNAINYAKELGLDIAGIIINRYPQGTNDIAIKTAPGLIEEYSGVSILGIIPEIPDFELTKPGELINVFINSVDIEKIFRIKIPKLNLGL